MYFLHCLNLCGTSYTRYRESRVYCRAETGIEHFRLQINLTVRNEACFHRKAAESKDKGRKHKAVLPQYVWGSRQHVKEVGEYALPQNPSGLYVQSQLHQKRAAHSLLQNNLPQSHSHGAQAHPFLFCLLHRQWHPLSIYLAYTEFKNTVSHIPTFIKLLPVAVPEEAGEEETSDKLQCHLPVTNWWHLRRQ